MKGKIDKLLDSNMTWRSYIKVGCIGLLVSLVITGLSWIGIMIYEKKADELYEQMKEVTEY